jgi:hypothetical protein
LSDCAIFFEMKKIFTFLFTLMMSAGFAKTASADVSGRLGYQRDYIIGKTKVFDGDLAVGNVNIPLGNGFAVNHWFAYQTAEKRFFERDWSLVKSFSATGGKVTGAASMNLYSFGSRYFDLADKGDAASIEVNASVPVAGEVSLFGGAEAITIIRADGDFTTAYAGVKLQTGKTFVKPRLQVRTDDSPFVRVDVGTSIGIGGITVNPSAKFIFAEDRQPLMQAAVEVPF